MRDSRDSIICILFKNMEVDTKTCLKSKKEKEKKFEKGASGESGKQPAGEAREADELCCKLFNIV